MSHDDQVRYVTEDRATRVAFAAAAYAALDGRPVTAVMHRIYPCRACSGWHIEPWRAGS